VLNAFFYGGGAVLWSVDVLGWPLRLTAGGVEVSLVIAARLLVIAAAAAWFAATTEAEAFEVALARLGVPRSLAFVGSLTVRLVPELRARYRAVEDAQRSRGLTVGGGPIRRARARIPVLFPFFVAVVRYGYDLGDALDVRGYGRAERRTYQLSLAFSRVDSAVALLAVALLVAFVAAFGPA
jgi:energy-coupling factor transporter transmembrane protein EcfT